MTASVLALAFIILLAAFLVRAFPRAQTIYEFQHGLLHRNGRFRKNLTPGQYRFVLPRDELLIFDGRSQLVTAPAQEILTSDSLSVKISISANYKIVDARKFHESATDVFAEIYAALQIGLRQATAAMTLDEKLTNRDALTAALAKTGDRLTDFGVAIDNLTIKDVMLNGELKRAFSEKFRVGKENEAALERARGEAAALRSLANSARMLSDNPSLYQLRLIQLIADGNGTQTIILNGNEGRLAASVANGG
ncbi:MAG: slipin family protein [Pseudomonadota bacterium]